jgi:uncharacterized protein DUF1269
MSQLSRPRGHHDAGRRAPFPASREQTRRDTCLWRRSWPRLPDGKFDTPQGADEALNKLEKLSRDYLINLHDAAVVSWEVGKKPKTHETHDTTKAGALGGAFWGNAVRPDLLVPFLGAATGAATGALFGSMRDVGISDDFIQDVRERSRPARRRCSRSRPVRYRTRWRTRSRASRPSSSAPTCPTSRKPGSARPSGWRRTDASAARSVTG